MDEQSIIDLYWNRDEKAIVYTEELYGAAAKRMALRVLESHEDAEECVNDAYLALWDSIPPKRPESLGAYLRRITRNLAINRYHHNTAAKRGGHRIEVALDELSDCIPAGSQPWDELEGKRLTQLIECFLEVQEKRKRQLFIRRYWQLEEVAELAKAFGMSENRISVTLYRLREKLRIYLQKEGVEI